jgi:hypothetical protein
MRTRHRIPTIFNLSMVDVLCCALGCVILLWLLNLRAAKERAEAAGQAALELAQARTDLETQTREASTTRDRWQTAQTRANSAEKDRDAARARTAELERMLTALRAEKSEAETQLARRTQEYNTLTTEAAAARKQAAALGQQVRDKETEARTAARTADELTERLHTAEARAKKAQAEADTIPALRDEARASRDKQAAALARVQELERELGTRKRDQAGASQQVHDLEAARDRLQRDLTARSDDVARAERRLAALEGEKRSLQDQAARARTAAENRFAGIALTGRRVVFLVDMSGSMELVDERTPAPGKWQGVRDTLARIMRSLPDLEKFQVLLFSDRALYPLGNDNGWLNFQADSVDRTLKALAGITPRGNTDMYAAFEAAFRLRPFGLDTIYVLSDGLPNAGPGLLPEQARQMKEVERNEVYSKHVRKTLLNTWNQARAGLPRVRINAVGFFYESPDVGAFLWALARENDGSFVGMSRP